MTVKLYPFIFLFFTISLASAQEALWLKQAKISEVVSFEKSIDRLAEITTPNVSLGKDYYPLSDKYQVTKPISIQRKAIKYLPVYAEYFFTPGDSILRLVSYNWEKDRYGNLFEKQKQWREENTKLTIYNAEYERIQKDLLSQLGKPTTADSAIKEENTGGTKYLSRETLWDNEFFNATLNMIFASTTHRVRLTMYWKK